MNKGFDPLYLKLTENVIKYILLIKYKSKLLRYNNLKNLLNNFVYIIFKFQFLKYYFAV